MVSIYDIAKVANVSAATVSRALANNEKISQQVREQIQKIAEEMGYRPNLLARNLRQQSTSMLGLILDDVSDELGGFIAKGVEEEARKSGYSVLLWNMLHNTESEKSALEYFSDLKLDGVILAETTLDSVKDFSDLQMPAVFINRAAGEQQPIHCVLTDDYAGAYDATTFLLGLNHQRIGYINGPEHWIASQKRLAGYLNALKEHNIEPCGAYIKHGDWYEESGYRLARELLQLADPPTAILASSDMMAIGVLDAARELGIAVPEQLSVMGYDNRLISQYARPRLTTISLPLVEAGAAAVKMLAELISNKYNEDYRKHQSLYIRGHVIERESTARRIAL